MLVREEIEKSFGSGPEPQPIEELLTAGRRRLRRRRVTEVVAAAAVIGVVGATYAAVAPGAGVVRDTPPVAADPSGWLSEPSLHPEEVRLTDDGRLLTGEDVELLDRVDNPAGVESPEYSMAVDVSINGERQWMFLTTGPGSGGGGAQLVQEEGRQAFRAWVEQWAASEMGVPVEGSDVSTEGSGQGDG
jgi:hypothetical protein